MPDTGARAQRWRKLAHEAAKFGIVGGLNTVINFLVFNALVLTVLHQGQLKANVVATVVATTASYFMNRHWTYRDRPKSTMRREYTLFFLFNGAGLVIELAVLGGAKYGLGLTSLLALNLAKFTGLALGTLFRFWAYRTFVFRPAPAPTAVAPEKPGARQNFDQLTATLEAELDGPLDTDLAAELAKADMVTGRRTRNR
ncbi:GtrA family protein [Rhizomonospora bruguierae]|uniref:GtrA family protein n=1 Tax=Rhizomonospora bruguierae TaxID=1581705 RepID=UPI001BCDBEE2|nr:GtrA family protein [Micromonospora sp. NBRC 107566]